MVSAGRATAGERRALRLMLRKAEQAGEQRNEDFSTADTEQTAQNAGAAKVSITLKDRCRSAHGEATARWRLGARSSTNWCARRWTSVDRSMARSRGFAIRRPYRQVSERQLALSSRVLRMRRTTSYDVRCRQASKRTVVTLSCFSSRTRMQLRQDSKRRGHGAARASTSRLTRAGSPLPTIRVWTC